MKRTRLVLLATAALMLAAVTSYGVYQILQRASAQGQQVAVVVAAQDLPVGTLLQPKHLKLARTNASAVPQHAILKQELAQGRGVLYPVAANEVLLESKLAAKDAGGGLPSMIPEGYRAVSVKVNEVVSVAGFVQPGTRVDVLLTGSPDSSRKSENVTTTTVLENVQVLAAGTQLQQNAKGEATSVPVITLLVDPQDAQRLTLAAAEGRIQLSLRNPLDRNPSRPKAVQTSLLYGGAPAEAKPRPAKIKPLAKVSVPPPPPQQIYMVEIIRGDKRDLTKF